ncbi:MAG: sulfite exporter TauE/SafE family protein [Gammaproteobacteria bacterium]
MTTFELIAISPDMEQVLIYLLVGALAGVIAGLFGVGGGLLIVPVLTFIFAQNGFDYSIIVHLAIGTSLTTIIFTSLSSIRAHHRHAAIQWPVVKQLAPGIVVGAVLGAIAADFLPTTILKTIFAIFEFLVAMQMLFSLSPDAHQRIPSSKMLTGIGTIIGSLSSILGIGGGTLTVPFLVWCRVPLRRAIATSSACGLPIAIAGSVGFLVVGLNNSSLPDYTTGYIHWPSMLGITFASMLFAPLGAKLTHVLPVKILRKSFSFLLLFLAVKMVMQ